MAISPQVALDVKKWLKEHDLLELETNLQQQGFTNMQVIRDIDFDR